MPLAMITWLETEAKPPEPPLGIWGPTDPRPTHPICIPPDAIAPGVPTHPIFLPVYPSHPIVIPPDGLAPGVPTHPIYLPVYPSHPIVIPPDAVAPGVPTHPIVLPPYPDNTLPGPPNVPTHPIVIPPEAVIPDQEGKAHVVVYYGGERVTFTVDMSGTKPPPTAATPKPAEQQRDQRSKPV